MNRTQVGLDILGGQVVRSTTRVGDFFDIASIFKAGGEIVDTGLKYKDAQDKKAGDAAAAATKLQQVLAADSAATDALAQAMYSTDLANNATPDKKDAYAQKANADAAVAAQAAVVQDTAAAGITPDVASKRLTAAQTSLTNATKAASKAAGDAADDPKNLAKKAAAQQALFRVKAAQTTALKAAGPSASAETKKEIEQMGKVEPSSNFFTKKLGPLPVYGWAGVGVGAGGLLYVLKRWLFKR